MRSNLDEIRGSALSYADSSRHKYRGKVINMGIGEPDFRTPPEIIKTAHKALLEGRTHYADNQGLEELREIISKRLRTENKLVYDTNEIIVTPGAKHAIFEAVMSVVEPGDKVVILSPHWPSFEDIVKIAGGVPSFLDILSDDNLDEKISQTIDNETKLVIINSPNNPSGKILSYNELKRIADEAASKDFLVLSDEIYDKITYETKPVSIGSLPGMRERTVTINGFSKTFAMTGWRIGYAAASSNVIKRMAKIQQHTVTCVPPFSQLAAVTALTSKEVQRCVQRMIIQYRKRRELLVHGLEQMPQLFVSSPEGTFYVFPKFEYQNMNSLDFAKFLFSKCGVKVAPGAMFGGYDDRIRLSFSISTDEIRDALSRLSKAVQGGDSASK